jgi:hypothetical protein
MAMKAGGRYAILAKTTNIIDRRVAERCSVPRIHHHVRSAAEKCEHEPQPTARRAIAAALSTDNWRHGNSLAADSIARLCKSGQDLARVRYRMRQHAGRPVQRGRGRFAKL